MSEPVAPLIVGLVWPYAEWGGVQTHFAALATHMNARHRLLAFVPRSPAIALVALLEDAGVEVVEAGMATRTDTATTAGAKLRRRLHDVRAHEQLWRCIRRHRPFPDVFHVDIPVWNGTLLLHRVLLRAPVVQTFHTPLPAPTRSWRDVLLRAKFRSLARRSRYRLHAATEATARSLRPWVGDRPPIDVIGTVDLHAVDTAMATESADLRERLGVPSAQVVIGTLGQLIERKGLDLLVEAAHALVDAGVDCQVLLGGEGPERTTLLDQASALGLADRLTIVSPLELGPRHADQLALLAALDVLVMPSRAEGLPLTLLEALAMQRPAVVADVGAIGEVFRNGDDLLLIPPDDVGALVRALRRLVDDDDLRARLGGSGHGRVLERFEPARAAERHEAVLAQLR